MTLYGICFYLIAVLILVATGLAVSRRNPVHAVIYLILSFVGSALLFYLFGAPFLAALEVIIYAGAIMVLFLFVLMMLSAETRQETRLIFRRWIPAVSLGLIYLLLAVLLVWKDPGSQAPLKAAMAAPKALGRFVFERYGLAVEILSLLLLIGLMAAIHLGRGRQAREEEDS
jgi:NADH-quinone oxidoreductase subunit J